jgi:hypothetical protein
MVAFLWKLSLELCLWASIVLQSALHVLPCFGTYLENIDTYYVACFFPGVARIDLRKAGFIYLKFSAESASHCS